MCANVLSPITLQWENAPHPLFPEKVPMNLHLAIGPLVSLLAGILILAVPRLLNYIVAVYLIVTGLLGLFGDVSLR